MSEYLYEGWSRRVWREVADQAAAAVRKGLFEHQLLGLVIDPNGDEKALALAQQLHPEQDWTRVNGKSLPWLAGVCPAELQEELQQANPRLGEIMNSVFRRGGFLVLVFGRRKTERFSLNLPRQRRGGGQW